MSTDKPSQNEDEYFARRDAELVMKKQAEMEKAARLAERKSHYLKCPKCGADLETIDRHGVQIDQCPDCQGIWLDAGEFDTLSQNQDPGFVGRVFGDLFAGRKKK
ncbi:MAG: zf-TFIIB domain-containing protein [Gemmatimonadales bacterium]